MEPPLDEQFPSPPPLTMDWQGVTYFSKPRKVKGKLEGHELVEAQTEWDRLDKTPERERMRREREREARRRRRPSDDSERRVKARRDDPDQRKRHKDAEQKRRTAAAAAAAAADTPAEPSLSHDVPSPQVRDVPSLSLASLHTSLLTRTASIESQNSSLNFFADACMGFFASGAREKE